MTNDLRFSIFVFCLFQSFMGYNQSEEITNVTWRCTDIVINGNVIQAPSNAEVGNVVLEMLQDDNPTTKDFITYVCNFMSSGDSDVIYNDANSSFTIQQLVQTLIVCDLSENGLFENNYFGFFLLKFKQPS